jgi:hypothetical protein
MPIEQIEAVGRAPLAALDDIMRAICADHAAGRLTDDETQALYEAVYARRKALKQPVQGHSPLKVVVVREEAERPPVANVGPRRAARSGPRQLTLRIPRPATYDRARSRERRRRLAYSGPMPARLAAYFTPGELAALRVIADEVRDHGKCDLTLGKIAACAGVGRTTVQNAIRVAERLGLVAVQERRLPGARSLPNVIRIVSAEWRSWIERGRKGGGFKIVNPTDRLCFTRGLRGNIERATAGGTQLPYDRGSDRAHRSGADTRLPQPGASSA